MTVEQRGAMLVERLARDLGLTFVHDQALRVPHERLGEAHVQLLGEDSLLIQRPFPVDHHGNEQDSGETALLWVELLVRNCPGAASPRALYGLDGEGMPWAFGRLDHASRFSPEDILRWCEAFIAYDGTDETTVATAASPFHPAFEALWRDFSSAHGDVAEDQALNNTWTVLPEEGVPVQVTYEPHSGDLWLRALVSVLPTEAADDEAYFHQLLQANLLGIQTNGSVLAIDADENELIVWHRESVRILGADELAHLIAQVSRLAQQLAPESALGESNEALVPSV